MADCRLVLRRYQGLQTQAPSESSSSESDPPRRLRLLEPWRLRCQGIDWVGPASAEEWRGFTHQREFLPLIAKGD